MDHNAFVFGIICAAYAALIFAVFRMESTLKSILGELQNANNTLEAILEKVEKE